jgi:hypothetical protein
MINQSDNKKYVRVMFENTSSANGFEFKENEVNVVEHWNPNESEPDKISGFNFSVEDKILRYLVRGDTLCDVILPEDTEVIDYPSNSCPHGIFRANKIIVSNIRPMTDDLAYYFYKKAAIKETKTWRDLCG